MAIPLIPQQHPAPDSHPDLVIDDNEGKGVGQWVPQQKHLLLSKYVTATRMVAKQFPEWVLIDPFSGPGRIQVKGESFTRPGGAVVAWLQAQAAGKTFTRILIGDIAADRVAACKARLEAHGAPVTAFHGPADETVAHMLDAVPQGAFSLIYIDPYNLSLLSYSLIQKLASLSNVDFIVHFSTMDLMRNVDMELDPERARFDEVLPGWREEFSNHSKSSLAVRFFEKWHERVKTLGYEFSTAMPLIMNDDNRGIYRLVCFSRHPLALRIWKDIARDRTRDLF